MSTLFYFPSVAISYFQKANICKLFQVCLLLIKQQPLRRCHNLISGKSTFKKKHQKYFLELYKIVFIISNEMYHRNVSIFFISNWKAKSHFFCLVMHVSCVLCTNIGSSAWLNPNCIQMRHQADQARPEHITHNFSDHFSSSGADENLEFWILKDQLIIFERPKFTNYYNLPQMGCSSLPT